MNQTSKLIAKCRQNKGLTRKAMAKQLGFSDQFYGRIEMGHVKLPAKYYKKFIKAASIDKDVLVKSLMADYKHNLEKLI